MLTGPPVEVGPTVERTVVGDLDRRRVTDDGHAIHDLDEERIRCRTAGIVRPDSIGDGRVKLEERAPDGPVDRSEAQTGGQALIDGPRGDCPAPVTLGMMGRSGSFVSFVSV